MENSISENTQTFQTQDLYGFGGEQYQAYIGLNSCLFTDTDTTPHISEVTTTKGSAQHISENSSIFEKTLHISENSTTADTSRYISEHSNTIDNSNNADEYKTVLMSNEIRRLVAKDEFIEGEVSKTQLYLEMCLRDDPVIFTSAFQKAYLSFFTGTEYNLYTFIGICSGIDYYDLNDSAIALIIAGCAHKSILVKEATIRAIEAWEQPSFIEYLEQIDPFDIDWLEEYRTEVIKHLEGLK
ncbi:hypothetical protein [Thalassomonas sp. RHCl1]|uniref:hypothetical protein n=1 Tax=Thalassomonas sp. RHCl1 TaxID=2995320 RepID=UPI00248C05AA|nr:hypothetical protein [Thalassomonas sp. RHCl1]